MKKKIVSLTLASVLALSALAGCGNTTTDAPAADGTTTDGAATTDDGAAPAGDDTTPAVDDAAPVAAATMEAPSTDGWDDSMKIYAYSWNDEFGGRLQYVLDAYPEYADYVEYVNLGVSGTDGTYQAAIDSLIANNDAKFPSIIAADNDVAKYYSETAVTLPMSEVGITADMYANAYQYTVDYATYDGVLKAVTWQATPGSVVYRADIAEEVLGASDHDTVQAAVATWDKFFETAEAMKAAGYKMTSGPDEIKYACFDQQTSAWVQNDTLKLDSSVTDFFELSKKLYDGGYTNNGSMWDATWNADYEGDVFCYFGCTWSVYWCMVFNGEEDSTYGSWRVTEGPVGYHWGGTYLMVVDGCPNTELAGFLLYELCCDADLMYTVACDTLDFVNNKEAIAKEIANGDGASPILGGQNPVETWDAAARLIDLSNATYLDAPIKDSITKASTAYNNGELATVDDAVQYVIDDITGTYSYISAE